MAVFSEKQINEFIAREAKYHLPEILTREKAIKFMEQREYFSSMAPVPKNEKPYLYEDQYGNERWSDTGERSSERSKF